MVAIGHRIAVPPPARTGPTGATCWGGSRRRSGPARSSGPPRFTLDVAEAAERAGHHPDVDIRYPDRVHVALTTHAAGGAGHRRRRRAGRRRSRRSRRRPALTSEPTAAQACEVAIDALDIDAVRPFWQAVLGYVAEPPTAQHRPGRRHRRPGAHRAAVLVPADGRAPAAAQPHPPRRHRAPRRRRAAHRRRPRRRRDARQRRARPGRSGCSPTPRATRPASARGRTATDPAPTRPQARPGS